MKGGFEMNIYLRSSVAILVITSMVFSVGIANAKTRQKKKPYRIWVTATAYCPCSKCCGKHANGITSTGRDANKAGVAVDPELIPKNSHLDIPGYKRGPNKNGSWIICDDVGGAIKGPRIDVRFKTHQEALKWGVKRLLIRVHESQ